MMKATHYGHCQACGSRQKLPAGVLAKHGYTTRWGFFSGVCPGSGRGPFETHTDYIADCISFAERQAATLRAEAFALSTRTTTGSAFYHLYVAATWTVRQSSYRWIEVELRLDGFGNVCFDYDKTETNGATTRTVGRPNVAGDYSAARVRSLDADAVRRDGYAAWQQKRIATWTAAPLVAIAA